MLRTLFFLVAASTFAADSGEVLIPSGNFQTAYFPGIESHVATPIYFARSLVTSKDWKDYLSDTKQSFVLHYWGKTFPNEDRAYLEKSLSDALSYDPFPAVVYDFFKVLDFCNWKSRKQNLMPVYRVVWGSSLVVGERNLNRATIFVNTGANGFRLPTFSEYVAAISLGRDATMIDELQPDFSKGKDPTFYTRLGFGYDLGVNEPRYYETGLTRPDYLGITDLMGCINVYLLDTPDYNPVRVSEGVYRIDTIDQNNRPKPVSIMMVEGRPRPASEPHGIRTVANKQAFADFYLQSAIIAFGIRLCRNATP